MSTDITRAAISYFGLPDGTWCMTSPTPGTFAFVIPLTEEHLRGIADRMKALAEPLDPFEPGRANPTMKTREELRAEYNDMSPAARAGFGSFARYVSESLMGAAADDAIEPAQGVAGREVKHVDVPVEDDSELPEAVWVPENELSNQQFAMASDARHKDGKPWCLMQAAMLDAAQRAKYCR